MTGAFSTLKNTNLLSPFVCYLEAANCTVFFNAMFRAEVQQGPPSLSRVTLLVNGSRVGISRATMLVQPEDKGPCYESTKPNK